MILFGLGWGNAPIVEHAEWWETPVGETCLYCGEPILATDSGCIMPVVDRVDADGGWDIDNLQNSLRPQHRECNLRSVIGGLNHQRGTCHCYGGSDDPDPPSMTRHQAAIEALREFEKRHNRLR